MNIPVKPVIIPNCDPFSTLIFKANGFKRATSIPVKKGCLIEVHPTVIFKKLKNPGVKPNLWISRKEPISKSKSKGKEQRRKILKDKFPGQRKIIDIFTHDYLDALIAAYTAESLSRYSLKNLSCAFSQRDSMPKASLAGPSVFLAALP